MAFTEYASYDGLGLAELVRQGKVTALELVEEAIRRIEAHNPKINAVIQPMYDQARTAARGPLSGGPFSGVPFLLKDLLSVYAGVPMRSGSRFLRDYVPNYDSALVKRFRAAGLLTVGKTNTPEFGLTPFTEPEAFGPTRNPWDLERTSGGSSGGSAAAVAARMVPIAGGGDGGGSIRIPAACCGLFGLKPTRGRNPTGPIITESWHGMVVEHVLTRSVRDSAALLDATAGPDSGAPYYPPAPARPYLEEVQADPGQLRIAFTTRPFMGTHVHDDCVQGVQQTVKLLSELGHTVEEAAPQMDGEALAVALLTMLFAEVREDMDEAGVLLGKRPTPADFEAVTWALGLMGRATSAAQYVSAVRTIQYTARRVGQFFDQYDVLVTPTLAEPPVRVGSLQPSASEMTLLRLVGRLRAGWLLAALGIARPMAAKSFAFIPYTPVFNMTGQPAMSVPLHWNAAGLPIGIQFVGRFADEAALFRLAGQLERACPWFDRAPAIS